MFPRRSLAVTGFSQDQWSKLIEGVEAIEEIYSQLMSENSELSKRASDLETQVTFLDSSLATLTQATFAQSLLVSSIEKRARKMKSIMDFLTKKLDDLRIE